MSPHYSEDDINSVTGYRNEEDLIQHREEGLRNLINQWRHLNNLKTLRYIDIGQATREYQEETARLILALREYKRRERENEHERAMQRERWRQNADSRYYSTPSPSINGPVPDHLLHPGRHSHGGPFSYDNGPMGGCPICYPPSPFGKG